MGGLLLPFANPDPPACANGRAAQVTYPTPARDVRRIGSHPGRVWGDPGASERGGILSTDQAVVCTIGHRGPNPVYVEAAMARSLVQEVEGWRGQTCRPPDVQWVLRRRVRERMDAGACSLAQVARDAGIPQQTLDHVIKGRGMSARTLDALLIHFGCEVIG